MKSRQEANRSGLVVLAVELDRVELFAVKQEQVDVVLALPSIERAADRLLAGEGVASSVGEYRFGFEEHATSVSRV